MAIYRFQGFTGRTSEWKLQVTQTLSVLGISGSLRKRSYNTGLLRAARSLSPDGMEISIFDIAPIPLFNADKLAQGEPVSVLEFKARIAAADALLIATPEYNHSIPGVLKNALDWASRPRNLSPFRGKPVALVGAGGSSGTIYAQQHLHTIAEALGMQVLPAPSLLIARAWEKFDPAGNLSDEHTRQELAGVLAGLAAWTLTLQPQEKILA